MSFRTSLLATLAALAFTGTAHAAVFNLGTVASGTTPTFSITAGGQTATFSSPAGNGFTVQSTSGLLNFSPALLDNNFFGTDPLTITFSSPVFNEILIPFAIQDAFGSGDTLSTVTSAGVTRLFSTTSDGLPLSEPEGLIAFVPVSTGITSLTLSSPQGLAFAIGNVTVPEPMSLSILGLGLAGLAVRRRRA